MTRQSLNCLQTKTKVFLNHTVLLLRNVPFEQLNSVMISGWPTSDSLSSCILRVGQIREWEAIMITISS